MRRLTGTVAALFIGVAILAGQTSGLSGTVRGEKGSVMPGVTVRLEGPALEKSLTTTTSAKGTYAFADVPVADGYVVTFSLVCFHANSHPDVTVAADQKATVDAVMRFGRPCGDEVTPAFPGDVVPITTSSPLPVR